MKTRCYIEKRLKENCFRLFYQADEKTEKIILKKLFSRITFLRKTSENKFIFSLKEFYFIK
jgi:hypothetical protein